MSSSQTEIDSLVSLARIGFEEDLYRLIQAEQITRSELARRIETSSAYISKIFNGTTNYTLQTMAKLAKAVGAIVQIRLVSEGREVVRVMDVDTARRFDDQHDETSAVNKGIVSVFRMPSDVGQARILRYPVQATAAATGSPSRHAVGT